MTTVAVGAAGTGAGGGAGSGIRMGGIPGEVPSAAMGGMTTACTCVGDTSQLSSAVGALGAFPAWGACTPSIVLLPGRAGAGAGATFAAETPRGATGGVAGVAGDAGFGSGGFGGDAGPRAPAWLILLRCTNPGRCATDREPW